MLWHEARNALRSLRLFDRVFFVMAGGLLLVYNIGNFVLSLRAHASAISHAAWLWRLEVPATLFFFGIYAGAATAGVSLSRAFAPFLLALPLSIGARQRMAVTATLAINVVLAPAIGFGLGLCCEAVHKAHALVLGISGAALFILGAATGLLVRLLFMRPDRLSRSANMSNKTIAIPGLRRLEGATPAWAGSWARGLAAGRLQLTASLFITLAILGLAAVLCGGASLAQHQAAPAVIDAIASGLVVFMLNVRCHPLGSPVLRAAPIGFVRSWLGVLRLPLVLSAIFFALPASIALAAQPASWRVPVAGGFSLLLLDGAYAVFAAYFQTAPVAAAVSFFAVLSYAAYQWGTYHDVAYVGLVVFLTWLWRQTRRRFLHG